MLSPQQETFWHQGLKGGDCKQIASKGMMEVAWYLPGRHGDNCFDSPVTFLNVRQRIEDCTTYSRVCDFASAICVFTEAINDELLSYLQNQSSLNRVILVILHRKDEEKKLRQQIKDIQATFGLEKYQVIRKSAEDVHFNAVKERLKASIDSMVKVNAMEISLSEVVTQSNMELDDKRCYQGHMAAQSILRDIDRLNSQKPGSAKAEILPCQSDLKSRQDIASLDKELCRQKKLKLEENTTVQNYAFDVKKKKWKLQLNQLQNPFSDTFKYFLQCIVSLGPDHRKYFLQCLKIGLNERSVKILQPLYKEYEKCRIQDDGEKKDKQLKDLDKKLAHGSLGIEHFFREMAVVYDNLMALATKSACTGGLDGILNALSGAMTEVLMEGTAIEIMDGDAVSVPVAWLNAVLGNVENCTKSTLFKVSVLGAQSCGSPHY